MLRCVRRVQRQLFDESDLPLFSGTPIAGKESAFVSKKTENTATQMEMFDAHAIQITPDQARAKLVELRKQKDKDAETLALIIQLEKIVQRESQEKHA